MRKNFTVLKKATTPVFEPPATSEFGDLILRLFQTPSALAIVGIGLDKGAAGVCEGIATELAASGKRVVIVAVDSLLRMNPIAVPREMAFMSGIARNVWLWPSPLGRPVEFLKSPEPRVTGGENWLDVLRQNFDSVLLDCPALDTAFGVTEVAAMADASVLLVEAERTTKKQIQHGQRALQLRGATLAGCILLRRS
jgi:Mrp family chromosome partitioning ATPase